MPFPGPLGVESRGRPEQVAHARRALAAVHRLRALLDVQVGDRQAPVLAQVLLPRLTHKCLEVAARLLEVGIQVPARRGSRPQATGVACRRARRVAIELAEDALQSSKGRWRERGRQRGLGVAVVGQPRQCTSKPQLNAALGRRVGEGARCVSDWAQESYFFFCLRAHWYSL